jgi:hypothetical protein
MLSLPLFTRFIHFGRLSATVKCGLLSLALIVSCALFAGAPSYLREGPIDFKAPAYPTVAGVNTHLYRSFVKLMPLDSSLLLWKYYQWTLNLEHL